MLENIDLFKKYNQRDIKDRQLDTLIGLSKGISADGTVVQAEAEYLLTWLQQNSQTEHPIILNLLNKVTQMLEDGVLDQEESVELHKILEQISGEPTALGELAKTSVLPICSPAPKLRFEDKKFLFTGTFAYGTRKQCQEAIAALGGVSIKNVTKDLDYLILGVYVSDSWAHETFGRKIEKAIEYRDAGVPLSIITEEHWISEAGL
ncbi:BRCT domain-containing protein [Teredinibacter sp. KSP-S5-2]|uniref:BRCT domain-containing protein n=1 Tax=Teredinibacter sp. KSP-S5-2 TaxID=3034506 RepID=UPI002934D62B|nr:BRCT domain-containing protein [Teredinibacter sp. KSP-S5-2]WNO10493.1 BRCT domain-containing protein [Teredinibacter sp. KSP-S5-2]